MVGLTEVVGVSEIGCVIMPLGMSTMQVRNMLSTCVNATQRASSYQISVNEDAAEVPMLL